MLKCFSAMFVKAMPSGALLLFLKRYQVSDKKGLKAISLQCVTDKQCSRDIHYLDMSQGTVSTDQEYIVNLCKRTELYRKGGIGGTMSLCVFTLQIYFICESHFSIESKIFCL